MIRLLYQTWRCERAVPFPKCMCHCKVICPDVCGASFTSPMYSHLLQVIQSESFDALQVIFATVPRRIKQPDVPLQLQLLQPTDDIVLQIRAHVCVCVCVCVCICVWSMVEKERDSNFQFTMYIFIDTLIIIHHTYTNHTHMLCE